MTPRIALTGMMGSGKSAVGRRLAERLGAPFLDLDEEIERSEGRSIAEIFRTDGEERFRAAERAALARICRDFDGVIATGGGVVLSAENRGALRKWGEVIYLRTGLVALACRLREEEGERPLLGAGEGLESRLEAILDARRDLYETAAHVIDTDRLDPDRICGEIVAKLSRD